MSATASESASGNGCGSESLEGQGHDKGEGDGVHAGEGEDLEVQCCRWKVEGIRIRSCHVDQVQRVALGWGDFPGRPWVRR